jgi:hypothetical protein
MTNCGVGPLSVLGLVGARGGAGDGRAAGSVGKWAVHARDGMGDGAVVFVFVFWIWYCRVIVHDMREWCWVSFAGGVYCYMVCLF